MKNAINWFEISTTQLDRAQAFYEAVLGSKMRRESMGPSEGAIFAYDKASDGVGGALMMGPTATAPGGSGTLVYLDASPSLDAALARVVAAGGAIALPRQALPPGLGFFAHFIDLDGNRVGLHALV
ncbi:MAG: VOC family protein [Rhodoferax sp.]|uniref:VOC family protein n=1 Tax=Rhodoferax sp. TaxID=50421 RepID=UPI002612A8E1|nr:VOC family protein [Rhodoferax sp.]MDD5334619.1 VOC family protein [Rhodoferax sp.]